MTCIPKCLGCLSHCDDLVLPLLARQSGMHTLEVYWLGSVIEIEAYVVKGMRLKFKNKLNESAKVNFRIKQPDGTYYGFVESTEHCPDDSLFSIESVITITKDQGCIEDFFAIKDVCITE